MGPTVGACHRADRWGWRFGLRTTVPGVSSFVDECNLNVKGGDGGAGCVSFRREAHVARGGPDGGDGGKGGDVWMIADRNVASLLSFRDHPHRKATSGTHGSGKGRHGHQGNDLNVHVPAGTTVRDFDGEVIADLVQHGDRWLAAAGGRGGRGNARFLSNKRRAPGFAEQGEVGDEQWVRLELRLLADVALVGYPNVGKSTLISRISAAKPKIADYPFTTLEPNLGVVRLDDAEFVVADIPGLIEGASDGKGLGIQFLRHVERARVLCVLLDLAAESGQPSPQEQLDVLLAELGAYQADLLDRPRVVLGSRADIAEPTWIELAEQAGALTMVSGVTGLGLDRAVGAMATAVTGARANEPEPEAFVVYRPAAEGFTVERADDGSFLVEGKEARRAVALSDLTNPEALDVAHTRLKQLGVFKRLARLGAVSGDAVQIGKLAFTYEPDDV